MQQPPNAFPPSQPGPGQPGPGQPGPGQPAQGSPPGQGAPPKKKANWALIGGCGCLSLLVVCCVVPITGYVGGNAIAKGDAEETVQAIAEAGRQRDASRLHGMLDSYFRTSTSVLDLTQSMTTCAGLSTNTAVTVDDVTIDHPMDNFIIVEATYETPTGSVRASIGLQRGDDGYELGTYSEYGAPGGHCDLRGRGY